MSIKEAVAERIIELCQERDISINEICNKSGIAPSTIYSILGRKSQNPGIVTIKKLCDGFDITIDKFFNTNIFRNLEQEII